MPWDPGRTCESRTRLTRWDRRSSSPPQRLGDFAARSHEGSLDAVYLAIRLESLFAACDPASAGFSRLSLARS